MKWICQAMLVLSLCAIRVMGQEALPEYALKAEWIKQFVRNLESRPVGTQNSNAVCRILVVGKFEKEESAGHLSRQLTQAGTTGSALRVELKDTAVVRDVDACDVLFLTKDVPPATAEDYFRALASKPVLTIVDRAALIKKGAILGMSVTKDKDIELSLSRANATKANVKFTPMFLEQIQKVLKYQ